MSEIDSCWRYLEREIVYVNPVVIVCLGRIVFKTLNGKFDEFVDCYIDGKVRCKTFGMYHPAYSSRTINTTIQAQNQLARVKKYVEAHVNDNSI